MSRKRLIDSNPALHPSPAQDQVRTLAYDFPANYIVESHAHEWHQLVYASRGVMTVETPDGSWTVPPNRGVWVPEYVEHGIKMSGEVSMRTLYIWAGLSDQLPLSCQVLDISPLLRELILHVVNVGKLDQSVPSQTHLIGVILDQLKQVPCDTLHVPQPRDPRARKIAAALEADPGDRRSLDSLAGIAGSSKRTIERLFLNETKIGFGKWRQLLRIAHALRGLATGQTVTTVALQVGYDSPSAFVAAFRKTMGKTPGDYFK